MYPHDGSVDILANNCVNRSGESGRNLKSTRNVAARLRWPFGDYNMPARSALITVLVWGITFACVGGVIGATIATVAPEYYRSVFRDGDLPNFNPLQVGIGLGATQGVASGIAISIAVLALLAWRDIRAARSKADRDSQSNTHSSASWTVHSLWGVATATSVILVSAATFVLGGIIGQQQLYQSWTDRKLDKLATILESRTFEGVEADYSSAAQVYLTGTTKDSATRDALRNQLVVTFGTEEADEMIWRVDVAQ